MKMHLGSLVAILPFLLQSSSAAGASSKSFMEEQVFQPDDFPVNDEFSEYSTQFGRSIVTLDKGKTIVASAPSDGDGGQGSIYVLDYSKQGDWEQTQKIVTDATWNGALGFDLDSKGKYFIASESIYDDEGKDSTGKPYRLWGGARIFKRSGKGAFMDISGNISPGKVPTGALEGFWYTDNVAMSSKGRTIALSGSVFTNVDGSGGAIWIMSYSPRLKTWEEKAHIPISCSDIALSADGKTLVVGYYGGVNVYTYNKRTDTWVETQVLSAPANNDAFGFSIALSDNGKLLVVGPAAPESTNGQLYVFTRAHTNKPFVASTSITAPSSLDHFGFTLKMTPDGKGLAVAGLIFPSDDSQPATDDTIWVYRSEQSGKKWTLVADPIETPDDSVGVAQQIAIAEGGKTVVYSNPNVGLGWDGLLYILGLKK